MTSQRQAEEITRKLRRAMTVADLIEQLQDCDQDALVVFTCDYGDYSHTDQALPVAEVEDQSYGYQLATSAYSQSGLELIEDDGSDEGDEEEGDGPDPEEVEQPKLVVLRHKSR